MNFKYLSLPPLPEHLKTLVFETVEKEWENVKNTDIHMNTTDEVRNAIDNVDVDLSNNLGWHYKDSKSHFPFICDYYVFNVPTELKKWLEDNISFHSAHIQVMANGSHVPPHIDEIRKEAWNYVIDQGGDVRTVFYDVKPEFAGQALTPFTVIPYEKLDISSDVDIQAERWHSLDTTKIHSVESINTARKRIAISISIL